VNISTSKAAQATLDFKYFLQNRLFFVFNRVNAAAVVLAVEAVFLEDEYQVAVKAGDLVI